jgi:hypothetical protein
VDRDEQREHLHQQLMDACVPLIRKAATPLELDTADEHVCAALMELCTGMFDAGIRAGSTEALAQLAERGIEAPISTDRYLLSDNAD